MANMNIIEAVGVTKSFCIGELHVDAVRGIDLGVRKGELLAIVGPSGSGKSTLLNLLGAIETPTTGHVLLEGVDVATLNDTERTLIRRRRIGFIFQAFNLLPTLTAIENVALPLELDGISESAARERAYGALELVDLSDRHDHVPSMMSGGEQQRVAVARALVIQPAIVLADEPTGNLDSVNSAAVMRLLRDLVESRGHTVIIVTHDNDIAAQADRTVHVRDGKLEDGDVLHMRRPAKAAGSRK
jgi:putative ABC transport system ATP-binding protein